MDNIDKFKELIANIQEDIYNEMTNLIPKFKEYIAVDHPDNPKYVMIEDIWYRNNYGCEENRYYYYYLPVNIQFIHRFSLRRAFVIYYDDKDNWWYVYDKEHETYTEFNALDTDTQIKIFEILNNILN